MPVDKAEIEGLVERLRQASGPDRELDAAICASLKIAPASLPDYVSNWEGEWRAAPQGGIVVLVQADGINGPNFRAPFYTATIDAALALVERCLPGWNFTINRGHCELRHPKQRDKDAQAFGNTTVIAILLALLTALGASK